MLKAVLTLTLRPERSRTSKIFLASVSSKVLLLLCCLILWTCPSFAQSPTSQPDRWREDLQLLAQELPRRHANLFFSLPATEFQDAVAELDAAIPALPDHVIITRLVQLVARVGDAHTSVNWASTAGFRRYPLLLEVFPDQNGRESLYVTAVTPDTQSSNRGPLGYTRALGARLVRIGDTEIEPAALAVASLLSAENMQWIKARIANFITTPEFLHALGLLNEMEQGRFTFENAAGQQFELVFKPVARNVAINWLTTPYLTRAPMPLRRSQPSSRFYWYSFLETERTVYFQYNRCQEMPTQPIASFTQELLGFIDTHAVDRLVVDLRQNAGGNSALLQPFIAGIRARAQLNQSNRLFVLIDRGTFSSGLLNAFDWQRLTNAILVGEPTGGKPNSYGEVRDFFLPRSNLRVVYSTRLFQILPGNPSSLFPSINLVPTIEDYLAGRDPVLEWVLRP
jgi:hypothetical protein